MIPKHAAAPAAKPPPVATPHSDWLDLFARTRARAEFAESLLCAMAFDHQAMLRGIYVDGPDDTHAMLTLMCGVAGECVFCDAARGE